MASLESSTGVRRSPRRHDVDDVLPELRKRLNVRKAPVLEWALGLAGALLLAQMCAAGWSNVRTWPPALAALAGLAALLGLLLARFDVALFRLFRPRRRDEPELPPLPSWLSEALTVSIVLLVAGFGLVLFGLAGLSFSRLVAAVVGLPRWSWIVGNILILAAAWAWRAASRR